MGRISVDTLEDILRLADIDPKHQTGEIVGSMTTNIHPKVFDVILKYIEKNQNDTTLYPSLSIIEGELISRTREILGLTDNVRGIITSGGTESNILAIFAAKKVYGSRTVIYLESAHQSVAKAAALLELNSVKVPVDINGYYGKGLLEKVLAKNPNSILVLTMGTTEIGRVDPIEPVIDAIGKYNVHLHIDGAMGGFTYPFTHSKSFAKYAELINEGLASFSADYHKFVGAPVPSSVLFLNASMEEKVKWGSHYMPSGYQKGLLGTRPGYSAAGALATLLIKKKEGLSKSALEAYSLALHTKEALENKAAFTIPKPDVPLLCIGLGDMELAKRAWEFLWNNGIKTYYCSKPAGLRIVFMPHVTKKHTQRLIERLLQFLGS